MFHPSWESEVSSKINELTPAFKRSFRPFRRELLRTAILESMIEHVESALLAHLGPLSSGLLGTVRLRNLARWFLQNDKRRFYDLMGSKERRIARCLSDYNKAETSDNGHFKRVRRFELTLPTVNSGIPNEHYSYDGNYDLQWSVAIISKGGAR